VTIRPHAALALALATLAWPAPPARAADPVAPGGVTDVLGPRTLALGAGVGVLSGNEGLFVNPGLGIEDEPAVLGHGIPGWGRVHRCHLEGKPDRGQLPVRIAHGVDRLPE